MSIQQYISMMKALIDKLAAVGKSVEYHEHLGYLLEGLPAEYDTFVTTVYQLPYQCAIEDMHSLLISYDLRLERRQDVDSVLP